MLRSSSDDAMSLSLVAGIVLGDWAGGLMASLEKRLDDFVQAFQRRPLDV